MKVNKMKKLYICYVLVFCVLTCYAEKKYTLSEALRYGKTDVVKQFFAEDGNSLKNVNLNATLRRAIWNGDIGIVKLLVEAGAEVNPTHGGETPMHVAAARDKLVIAKYLYEKGAVFDVKDKSGVTPLYMASENERKRDVALWLLELGAESCSGWN